MTCRQEIEYSFREKSRSDLLDYVCNRIDRDEEEMIEMFYCIGKVLAYIETKDFSQNFENNGNETHIRNRILEMLNVPRWYVVEHYKDNWKIRFKEEL